MPRSPRIGNYSRCPEVNIIDPKEQSAEKIAEACRLVAATDPETFRNVSHEEVSVKLGDEGVRVVAMIAGFYRRLMLDEIRAIPKDQRHVISQEVRQVQAAFEDIQKVGDASRANTLVALRSVYHASRVMLAPFAGPDAADTSDIRRELQALTQQSKEALSTIEDVEGRASKALVGIQQSAAEAGVSKHAEAFERAAKKYSRSAGWWFRTLFASAIAAASLVFWWVVAEDPPPANANLAFAIQAATGKLFVFGVLSYLIVWVGRAHRAAAHNQVVNEHRRDALQTFETFVNSTMDEATRDVILVQTTQCIFSHRPSGFGQQETDAAPPTHMVELTRAAMGAGDSSREK